MRRISGWVSAVMFTFALMQVSPVAAADLRQDEQVDTVTCEEESSFEQAPLHRASLDAAGCNDNDWAAVNEHCAKNHPGCYVQTCSKVSEDKVVYQYACIAPPG
ncbi:hypothetical protein MYSTI_07680 [Myxococcus stipitatus DSM 14675]|uniref:Lipoprotein n=1 Tax=Myxococcus stipitatus (strain DSM 14675 / JCM 12634 / Mx s8) TaxID=1278073 RepID=L7UN30_MYXSD|nr:hypothetical protein [Myxococcus stipitatus]AGC48952.1 hypothetical protein MYSTI_07680 [Myxococcus stipitatus DSM 14675]